MKQPEFEQRLEDLIDEALKGGVARPEIIWALEVKSRSLEDEEAEENETEHP